MKIVAINKYYQHDGGADRFYLDTEDILTGAGHSVIPYTADYPGNRKSAYAGYSPPGARGSEIDDHGWRSKAGYFVRGIYSKPARDGLSKLLAEVDIDVAHIHNIYYTLSPSVIDALAEKGIPIVYSMHDFNIFCANARLYSGGHCERCIGGGYHHAVLRKCYRGSRSASIMAAANRYVHSFRRTYDKVDVFTVPNRGMADRVVRFGIPESKVRLLPNPFIPDRFSPTYSGRPYCVFYGRLTAEKGILTLLDAMAESPEVPLRMYGRGPLEDHVAERVRSLPNVTLDLVTRWGTGLVEELAAARFVVCPSEWSSPLEYVVLESMAMGKGVLGARVGGAEAEIQDDVTGWLVEPASPSALGRRIRALFANPDHTATVGRAAREYIEENYGAQRYLSNIMEVYSAAMESRST